MADVKKATKTAKAKAPAGPKFSARFVNDADAVVRVSAIKRRKGYVALCVKFPEGDGAQPGTKTRKPSELIAEAGTFPTFEEASAKAQEFVAKVEEAGYAAQAKRGGRVAAGFEAL